MFTGTNSVHHVKWKRHFPNIFSSNWDAYWSLCFHPDNKHILFGSISGYICIYRLIDGKRIASEDIHDAKVLDLICTPDGRKLISCGEDGVITITNLENILSNSQD